MASSASIYIGEGLLPVPAKLAVRIKHSEFIDMAELLPEFWASLGAKETVTSGAACGAVSHQKQAVTDVSWIQCFATYVSVMSMSHPEAVPELLAYLIFILRVRQGFCGVAWVTYDLVFQQQAFITGNRQCSGVCSGTSPRPIPSEFSSNGAGESLGCSSKEHSR